MVAALPRSQFPLPAFSHENTAGFKNKTILSCQRAFSFLVDYRKAPLRGLLALGYDIMTGKKVLSTSSASFANVALTAGAYVAPILLKKSAAMVLSSYPAGFLLACKLGNRTLVRECITAGSDIHYRDPVNGATPLHAACFCGHTEVAQELLIAGAQVNARDAKGAAPLHYACNKGHAPVVGLLLGKGATAELTDNSGWTALEYAFQSPSCTLDVIKLLKGRVFQSCNILHDVYDVLFPPVNAKLPPIKELAANLTSDAFSRFEREALNMAPTDNLKQIALQMDEAILNHLRAYEQNAQGLNASPLRVHSIHALLQVLLERSPLFKKAWDLANDPEKIQLQELAREHFFDRGRIIHKPGAEADYNSRSHTIRIGKSAFFFKPDGIGFGGTHLERITELVFETINALQRKSFQAWNELVKKGEISREEFVLFKERLEFNSSLWLRRILDGKPDLPGTSFLDFWKKMNVPYRAGLLSHADSYRRDWNRFYSAKYIAQNPESFRKRLAELEVLNSVHKEESAIIEEKGN